MANVRAVNFMEAGAYLEAAQQYSGLGKHDLAEQCVLLYKEQLYVHAKAEMQAKRYLEAREDFVSLEDYKDSAELILSCDYMRAEELFNQGDYYGARELCLGLSDYPGQTELLEKCRRGIYELAMECACAGDYEQACRHWRELGDFKDCERLIFRAERMQRWLAGEQRMIDETKLYRNGYYKNVYKNDEAYVVVPEKPGCSSKFLVYYPGGTDDELNTDFLNYYLMNPAPDTIAVFMRRNGLKDIESKNSQMLETLERCAAECGVFVRKIVVAGSSMGAYPAMHSPLLSMRELGIKVECVLSLDAGADWETAYALQKKNCVDTAALGTEYYLFESPWVGMNRSAIARMVNSGIPVTIVGCEYDEHVRITLDAMGMGVLHWAVGDRTEPCELGIYMFNKLSKE